MANQKINGIQQLSETLHHYLDSDAFGISTVNPQRDVRLNAPSSLKDFLFLANLGFFE